MCFFGSGPKKSDFISQPSPVLAPAPAPTPAPLPSPSPTKVDSAVTSDQRRQKIRRATRFGLLSTIKTSPQGISGKGAELVSTGDKKKTLGA